MIYVLGIGFDALLVSLLRQINGGDFSDGNLWLCLKMATLFLNKWQCLLEEEPNIVREEFHLCLRIGRDFIRLLQDLIHVPEFRDIWKDLMLCPSKFNTSRFINVLQLYRTRTCSKYVLLRINPEMETRLRFLMTYVKLGHQKRHQIWFFQKFLHEPDRETIIVDIVRFICCAHHPPNEIIQSDIVPRWAVIGWLLKSCRSSYVEKSVKLALFYDWLYFYESVDSVMNIEPAILLMVHSIQKYIDITHNLLEFLLYLVDNFDVQVENKVLIAKGVSSALQLLAKKGVIHSYDVLIYCPALSPNLKEGLGRLISGVKS
ncbi:uncharacterized protein [Arachis hypogaea]|uniref:uncharacterized protein n=1 Tax=Arachis hypogaea TaxID=3818 RepID=UPI003B0C5BCC